MLRCGSGFRSAVRRPVDSVRPGMAGTLAASRRSRPPASDIDSPDGRTANTIAVAVDIGSVQQDADEVGADGIEPLNGRTRHFSRRLTGSRPRTERLTRLA